MTSRAKFDQVKTTTQRSIARSGAILLELPPLELPTIAIVGGGFSGAMVAIHLLRTATHPLQIKLIERRPQLGTGIAYGTQQACHLLNVPADKASALADDSDHFLRWLYRHGDGEGNRSLSATAFVPRQRYGQYIQSLLQEAIDQASPQVRLEQMMDEVVSIRPNSNSLQMSLRSGERQLADRVVLALGNPPPRTPAFIDSLFSQSSRYIASAWAEQSLAQLDPHAPVLLIGSGLTAVDVVLTLRQQGHQGLIHLVSRRGLLPQSHLLPPSYPFPESYPLPRSHPSTAAQLINWTDLNSLPPTTRKYLRLIRQQVEQVKEAGQDWRSIMDVLRPHVQTLWQSLSLAEKRRFLRHVRPYWEVHRHRMAPSIAQQIATWQQEKTLCLHAARVQTCREDAMGVEIVMRPRGSAVSDRLHVQAVVNCTGPDGDYRQSSQPLIVNLLAAGLIRPDPLHLGLDVASNGALLTTDGMPSTQLYTLGSPLRGGLWETTAISEIRSQAKALTQELLINVMGEQRGTGSDHLEFDSAHTISRK